MINVTIWNEFLHEKKRENVAKIYPKGIHAALAEGLASPDLNIRTATMDEPDHGLPDDVLKSTDVLIWWAHMRHIDVRDDIVEKIHQRVLEADRAPLQSFLQDFQESHRLQLFAQMAGCRRTGTPLEHLPDPSDHPGDRRLF